MSVVRLARDIDADIARGGFPVVGLMVVVLLVVAVVAGAFAGFLVAHSTITADNERMEVMVAACMSGNDRACELVKEFNP